jgi:sugar phosphate isomerase/epimerase
MKLSVASWSFPHLSLFEASAVAKAIGFEAIDLGYFFKASLDKQRLLTDPRGYGDEISDQLPLPIANLFHLFGDDVMERNLSNQAISQNLDDLKSAVSFAKAAGAPSVFILPGMINPGQSRSQAITQSAEALKPMVEAGKNVDVDVLIEPHARSILNSPTTTRALVDAVPGLKIVLDPSHFVAMGYRQEEIDPLADITGHVHLRQAKPGVIQCKMEEGIVDFSGLFGALRDAGYGGWLCSEYEHEAATPSQFDDVLSETVKMRDCFNNWAKPA